MINTPGFSDKISDFTQSGVETFQRCFPQNPGKFCTLINNHNSAQIFLHSDIVAKISSVPVPRKLPVILNQKEVTRLIEATANSPKYQAALSVAYGAGLRISEIVALKSE